MNISHMVFNTLALTHSLSLSSSSSSLHAVLVTEEDEGANVVAIIAGVLGALAGILLIVFIALIVFAFW